MRTHTRETQQTMTPTKALEFLREGNERFVENLRAHRNLLDQVNETRDGQFPFATVLSCIDSRTSAEQRRRPPEFRRTRSSPSDMRGRR